MDSPVIKVTSAWEEHAYVAQHRCVCEGELKWERAELRHGPATEWLETVWATCVKCHKESIFDFDVSEAVAGGGSAREMIALTRAWPAPQQPPYVVRAQEYKAASKSIVSEMGNGIISAEEAERRTDEKLKSCYPLIAGRYRVFGHRPGSMGVCYLCIDERSGRPVVAKTVAIGDRQNADVLHALRREAEVWIGLGNNAHIVSRIDVLAETPSTLTLIMEFVPPGPAGRTTLREWIDADPLPYGLALRFATHIATAMVHATAKIPGLVHGDLKPENILVSPLLSALVSDFGLARADKLPGLRLSGSGLGTNLYLAPECWNHCQASEQSDLYAFGLIICEMLTGHHPFSGARSNRELEFHHLNTAPTMPEGLLGDLARNCLQKRPDQRPSSFRDVLARLGRIVETSLSRGGRSALECNNRGTALGALGRHDEAIRCYEDSIATEPTNPIVWVNLGISWAKLGSYENAMRAYELALLLEPNLAHAHANIAGLYLRAGRPHDALAACKAALSANPDLFIALLNCAAAQNSLGLYEEAAATAERAALQDSKHPHALVEMGTAYWRLGRFSKARRCAETALKIDPKFEPARTLVGLILKRQE